MIDAKRMTLALATTLVLASACTRPAERNLDAELDRITGALAGSYEGRAPLGLDKDAALQPVFHKFVPLDAPQFGSRVLYYQLSTGSPDGKALQQKIFVFDTHPDRRTNGMRAFIPLGDQAPANLEKHPDALAALKPAEMMTFPAICGFVWSAAPTGFVGVTGSKDCAYESKAFGQTIRPQMRYAILGDRFEWFEVLAGEDGTKIVSTDGTLVASRIR